VTASTFKNITANGDVYENQHYLWDTLSMLGGKCAADNNKTKFPGKCKTEKYTTALITKNISLIMDIHQLHFK
jgi:hypothetical protein